MKLDDKVLVKLHRKRRVDSPKLNENYLKAIFGFSVRMYAIIQDIDGYLCVVGSNHRLYNDLEEAKTLYSHITTACILEDLRHSKTHSHNIPKLMNLQTEQIIYPSKDVMNDIKELYKTYNAESCKNDEEQFKKAKTLKIKLEEDIKSVILS